MAGSRSTEHDGAQSAPDPRPQVEAPTRDWRDRAHDGLRGHDLAQQVQMLNPGRDAPTPRPPTPEGDVAAPSPLEGRAPLPIPTPPTLQPPQPTGPQRTQPGRVPPLPPRAGRRGPPPLPPRRGPARRPALRAGRPPAPTPPPRTSRLGPTRPQPEAPTQEQLPPQPLGPPVGQRPEAGPLAPQEPLAPPQPMPRPEERTPPRGVLAPPLAPPRPLGPSLQQPEPQPQGPQVTWAPPQPLAPQEPLAPPQPMPLPEERRPPQGVLPPPLAPPQPLAPAPPGEQRLPPPLVPRTSHLQPGQLRPPLPPRRPVLDHTVAAERLDKGAHAVGLIKQGVAAAGRRAQAKRTKYEREVAEVQLANATRRQAPPRRRGLFALFRSRSEPEQELLPMPPRPASLDFDYEAGGRTLDEARGDLVADAQAARAQTVDPKESLQGAAAQMNGRADALAGQVEDAHAESLRDLAAGLESGSQAMIRRLMDRQGAVESVTLTDHSSLQQNQKANVFKAQYLGMAPVVAKISKEKDFGIGKAQDETLAEHRMLHQHGGKSHIMGAGGLLSDRRGFVMELARHGDLSNVKKKTDTLPPKDRVQVWRQLMAGGFQGLDQLHDQGMIHGDVKNENFLLGSDLTPKLMDLGTSKPVGEGDATGTPKYLAPEVGSEAASQASDVWSMGESLLLALFGKNSTEFAQEGQRPRREDEAKPTKRALLAQQAQTERGVEPRWLAKVREQARDLPEKDLLMDFLEKVMKLDPRERLTAKQALRHEFLTLKLKARTDARARLGHALNRNT